MNENNNLEIPEEDINKGIENIVDLSKETAKEDDEILLFRGVGTKADGNQVGNWWSTNPYYSYRFGNSGKGEMFVTRIKKQDLNKLAKDVSIESEYQNYFFKNDPPNLRNITDEERLALESHIRRRKLWASNAPGIPEAYWLRCECPAHAELRRCESHNNIRRSHCASSICR